ncbi:MAG: ATP-dependent RecD-like DNA helicase [Candidatus Pacebacteria bacterium]|nr:ATP-dependent RecD-like DNA helicase [Candidatus Paceibacterota bacterium]MCF7862710.1 ATP-dependent RecD-like DNA helicase [Candidatus Paceibacterota bacterium]
MNKLDKEILTIDKAICKNIDKYHASERGLLAQNILSQLRNFIERVALKEETNGQDIDFNFEDLKRAPNRLQPNGSLWFIRRFHNFLQGVAGHDTQTEENSERLMLKYYEYLLRVKAYLKNTHGLDVLDNIDKFPINTDPALQQYYEKIAERIERPTKTRIINSYNGRYYIQKIKPFFVNHEIYYEVTFTIASAQVSKFDRVIAFTKLNIPDNYAVKFSLIHDDIEVLSKKMPIQIIDKFEVSIRPCELNNFGRILGENVKIETKNAEYKNLMGFLTDTKLSLVELIDLPDDYYDAIKTRIVQGLQVVYFLPILDKVRTLVKNNEVGINVVRYLLHCLNNRIIKLQNSYYGGYKLRTDFNLNLGCKPFDTMPVNSSLIGHNPEISTVFECIDATDREHELFGRLIKNNTENKGKLYTPLTGLIKTKKEIESLVKTYNSKLYLPKHNHRKLENFNDFIYINGYEKDTLDIIKKFKELTLNGISNYSNSVDSWLRSSAYKIDCKDKEKILRQLFADSEIALVYGAAGTGKSTLINHISNFFNDNKKLYLANTYPALDNLKRKVTAANCKFQTIAKFLSPKNTEVDFDILIIDECSTVSNIHMVNVLSKVKFKSLILVGDVFQIEPIIFGNWFNIARYFIPKTAVSELTVPYRTTNKELIEFWNRVRNLQDNILESMTRNDYTTVLNESIFKNLEDDEIILCLNYDGLYGINNLNRFLQNSNENAPVDWDIQTYKTGDPILFNETERFAPLIYNNLKGRIVDINKAEKQIQFDIEIDKAINELQASDYDFKLVGSAENGNSIIRFIVNERGNTDEDDDPLDSVVPFQVAYAISIHKAQGLEYNSVKIVISSETEEMITHNIFYTAITRAKEKLKIYWTPEAEKKVLAGFQKLDSTEDVEILFSRLSP